MITMVDDDTIYEGFAEQLTDEDCKIVAKILTIWADALDGLPKNETSLRLICSASINTIASMGPAYCRVAAATLLHHADEADQHAKED